MVELSVVQLRVLSFSPLKHERPNSMIESQLPGLEVASSSVAFRSRHHQLLAVLLLTGLTLLFVHAATAQTRRSDSEMKEIVRLLLEREVQRPPEGDNVAVLLGPNVKPTWIPEVSGFAIRQISYDEQKQVPEYYDLTVSFKDSVIEAALTKGNFCRKAGRRYEFRRNAGEWQSKVVGYVESSAVGNRCDGCAVGSGATYSVLHQNTDPRATISRTGNLRLTGSVGKTSCFKDAEYVRCATQLNLTFTNTGSTSLIILQPQGEFEFWHGRTSLALSEKESGANSFVYDVSAWPSVYKSPMYQSLANLLDQSVPPTGITRLLLPSASWHWATLINLSFREGNSCNQHIGVEIGWEEIKRQIAPLWLRVSYEMWPFNVENFKPNLGGVLQKRWQSDGMLYLEEKSGRYWQAILTSEPMEFPLNQIELAR
jgi:hypothetical protein